MCKSFAPQKSQESRYGMKRHFFFCSYYMNFIRKTINVWSDSLQSVYVKVYIVFACSGAFLQEFTGEGPSCAVLRQLQLELCMMDLQIRARED